VGSARHWLDADGARSFGDDAHLLACANAPNTLFRNRLCRIELVTPPGLFGNFQQLQLVGCRPLVPGTMLAGRYRIVAKLGRGGMGEVFRAEDLTLEQEVALKFLPPDLANDPAALARFHSEVASRGKSHIPMSAAFSTIGMAGDAPFITMEYVDGEDLASLIRRGAAFRRTKESKLRGRFAQVSAAAHEQGLLHRRSEARKRNA